uniref:Uncharacterized protein n=1 Tax=Pseudomonas phage Ulina01 TaxID=3138549 RepID=A0AAU6VZS3_9CAUD
MNQLHRCCPSLLKFSYAATSRYTGATIVTSDPHLILDEAKFSLGVSGYGVCTRCGHEVEDLEWDRPDFVSHCETINDPL